MWSSPATDAEKKVVPALLALSAVTVAHMTIMNQLPRSMNSEHSMGEQAIVVTYLLVAIYIAGNCCTAVLLNQDETPTRSKAAILKRGTDFYQGARLLGILSALWLIPALESHETNVGVGMSGKAIRSFSRSPTRFPCPNI
jgi:hypothetical protein